MIDRESFYICDRCDTWRKLKKVEILGNTQPWISLRQKWSSTTSHSTSKFKRSTCVAFGKLNPNGAEGRNWRPVCSIFLTFHVFLFLLQQESVVRRGIGYTMWAYLLWLLCQRLKVTKLRAADQMREMSRPCASLLQETIGKQFFEYGWWSM